MKHDSKVHSKHTAWKKSKQNQYKHQILWVLLKQTCSHLEKSTKNLQTHWDGLIWQGYNLGISSLIEAILKNQFKQVSLAVSLTLSGEKLSGKKTNPEIVTLFLETSYSSH